MFDKEIALECLQNILSALHMIQERTATIIKCRRFYYHSKWHTSPGCCVHEPNRIR